MARAPRPRSAPDPFGRQVDLYSEDLHVTVLIPKDPDAGWPGRSQDLALEFVDRVRTHSVARVRESRFTIFVGSWQVWTGEHLVALAVAADMPMRTFTVLYQDVMGGYDGVRCDRGPLGDVNGVPLVRYERGSTIVYTEPGSATPEQPGGVEWRSYQIRPSGSTERSASVALPLVRVKPPTRHSLSSWWELQRDVLRFFHDIELPSTYGHLKRTLSEQFGVDVREVPRERINHHGRIMIDWLTDTDGGCEVSIEIARDLPAPLRYIVLAHEMAHYGLHFPLLLAAQAVEQMSWLEPGLDRWFAHEIERLLGDLSELEAGADELATYAVLPRWFDHDWNFALDVDRTPTSDQMKWGGLQSFFPVTRENGDFRLHRDRRSMLERESADLLRARGGSDARFHGMYEVLLAAAVRRGSPDAVERNQRVAQAISHLVHIAWDTPDAAVSFLRPDSSAQSTEAAEFDSSRELHPPLSDDGADLVIRRWPVVPGEKRGRLRSVLRPDAGEATLAEWRELVPRLAVVVYPDKRLPALPVTGFYER